MPALIAYNHQEGEVLEYRQTLTQVIEGPDQPRMGGKAVFAVVQQVLEVTPEGFLIQLDLQLRESEGLFTALSGSPSPTALLQYARNGRVLKTDQQQLPWQPAAFPDEEVEEDMVWTSQGEGPAVDYLVKSLDGDEALLFTRSQFEDSESISETHSDIVFNHRQGHQVRSTTVVQSRWTDGRSSQVLIEMELISRRLGASRINIQEEDGH